MKIHAIKQILFALTIMATAHACGKQPNDSKTDIFSCDIKTSIRYVGNKFFKANNKRYQPQSKRGIPIQKIKTVRYRGPQSKNQENIDIDTVVYLTSDTSEESYSESEQQSDNYSQEEQSNGSFSFDESSSTDESSGEESDLNGLVARSMVISEKVHTRRLLML